MDFRQSFIAGSRGEDPSQTAPSAEDLAQKAVMAELAPLTQALAALPPAGARSVALGWQARPFLGNVYVQLTIHYDTARGHARTHAPDIVLRPRRDQKHHPSLTVEAICDRDGAIRRWTVQDNANPLRTDIDSAVVSRGSLGPRDGKVWHPAKVEVYAPMSPATALGAALARLMPERMAEIEAYLQAGEKQAHQTANTPDTLRPAHRHLRL